MSTAQWWAGDFGKEYTERNRVDWRERIPFWQRMCDLTGAATFLDVGCNEGWNMLALRTLNDRFEMSGMDVNAEAVKAAMSHGLDVVEGPAESVAAYFGQSADMVITSGVLIHIAPDDLLSVMAAIRDASKRWVLAIEYAAEREEEVEYRGHAGKLWRRPFGDLYQNLGLALVETGHAEGYSDCTYWLLEREGA